MFETDIAGFHFVVASVVITLLGILVFAALRRFRRQDAGEDYARLVGNRSTDGMLVLDQTGKVLWVNDAYCRLTKRARTSVLGRNPLEFALPVDLRPTPEDIAAFRYAPADDGIVNIHRNIDGEGQEFWIEIATSFVTDSRGRERALLVCRDATDNVEKARELRSAYDRIEKVARTDPLTGIANRGEFLRVAEAALAPGLPALGLLHLDVDRFKEINDSIGHPAGDAVLCHIARVLQSIARSSDLVARLGGDEFVLVCPGIGDPALLLSVARRISERLSEPLAFHGRIVPCGVSIGGAMAEGGDLRPEDLLGRSDVALYAAKRAGRGTVRLYDSEMHREHVTERRLSDELRRRVADNRHEFLFRPSMCMRTGRIRGFETLVDWPRLRGGHRPAEVQELARSLGLTARIDLAAMEAALATQARLREELGHDLLVGFNASPELLAEPGFTAQLRCGMEQAGIAPDRIVVEVTEGVFFGDDDGQGPQSAALRALRDLGVVVLLDDFGIGHAGLTHLATLPVHGVKLDRSLIRGIETDARRAEIVRTLCALCQRLDNHIVVQGVQDAAQAGLLRDLGRIVVQGDHISPPLAADELAAFLGDRNAPEPLGGPQRGSGVRPVRRPAPSGTG